MASGKGPKATKEASAGSAEASVAKEEEEPWLVEIQTLVRQWHARPAALAQKASVRAKLEGVLVRLPTSDFV